MMHWVLHGLLHSFSCKFFVQQQKHFSFVCMFKVFDIFFLPFCRSCSFLNDRISAYARYGLRWSNIAFRGLANKGWSRIFLSYRFRRISALDLIVFVWSRLDIDAVYCNWKKNSISWNLFFLTHRPWSSDCCSSKYRLIYVPF